MGRIFETRKATMFKRWDKMAKAFTRIGKDIAIAVKSGGSSPESNPALRRVIQNARAANMPKDKIEAAIKPFEQYLAHGVSFIASHYSSKPRVLATLIQEAMDHRGFSIVHVQSPCTTYNDTYDILKGDKKRGIEPAAWDVPEDHDPTSRQAAWDLLDRPGIPLGVIYRDDEGCTTRAAALIRLDHPREEQAVGFDPELVGADRRLAFAQLHPDLYELLREYYRQDTAARFRRAAAQA